MPDRPSPIQPFLAQQGFLVLDGGLATELERRGHDLHDPLWSAVLLLNDPDPIRQVHLDYLRAGADVITTATYQATFAGLKARGLGTAQAEALFRRSVQLANEARSEFIASQPSSERLPPLIAASIGSYGAFLHDGSEYIGKYSISDRELAQFHRPRLEVLLSAGVDLVACETIPSWREAAVLAELLEVFPGAHGWIAFSARNDATIPDGTPFASCCRDLAGARSLVSVGINCTPAEHVEPLLRSAQGATTVPFVVYPNAGGTWHADVGSWEGEARPATVSAGVETWYGQGARLIGGCCRTTPATIEAIRAAMARMTSW